MTKISRRAFVALASGLALAGGCAHGRHAPHPSVLFVCQAGTVKSPIARELLRRRASERGMTLAVASRGIASEDHVSAELRAHVIHDGLDAALEPAERLDARALAAADIVVVFNPLPPALARADARDWTDMPSMNDDYANAFAYLDRHIRALLDELARER